MAFLLFQIKYRNHIVYKRLLLKNRASIHFTIFNVKVDYSEESIFSVFFYAFIFIFATRSLFIFFEFFKQNDINVNYNNKRFCCYYKNFALVITFFFYSMLDEIELGSVNLILVK